MQAHTPSATFNSKIRGKKIEFAEDEENLISKALSFIWIKTNKKVKSCSFEKCRATIFFGKEGRAYFDLVDREFLSDFTTENEV